MISKHLNEALALARHVRQFFVATVGTNGIPHLAIAERITLERENIVGVTAWFCPRTAENVAENTKVSLVVWDEQQDVGFQLIGEVIEVLNLAMLDGFIAGETETVPQIERKLVVMVDQIFSFSHAHHSDIELL